MLYALLVVLFLLHTLHRFGNEEELDTTLAYALACCKVPTSLLFIVCEPCSAVSCRNHESILLLVEIHLYITQMLWGFCQGEGAKFDLETTNGDRVTASDTMNVSMWVWDVKLEPKNSLKALVKDHAAEVSCILHVISCFLRQCLLLPP